MARGIDQMGKLWADARKIPVKEFPADWDGLGKKAGVLRNEEMAKYAKCLIAFWDYESSGTNDMIQRAKKHGLLVKIVDLRSIE